MRERERVIAKYREWELSAKFMQYNEHTSSRPREREGRAALAKCRGLERGCPTFLFKFRGW